MSRAAASPCLAPLRCGPDGGRRQDSFRRRLRVERLEDRRLLTVVDPGMQEELRTVFPGSSLEQADVVLQQATADGGTTLHVIYAITSGQLPPFDLGFFLSDDPNLEPSSDMQIDKATVSDPADLTPGTHTKTFTLGAAEGQLALPGAGLAETDDEYYVLVVADPQDLIRENDGDPLDEDNTVPMQGVYHPGGGDVYVHGTRANDNIAVSSTGTGLQVVVHGEILDYDLATTTGVRVRGHAGDDQVSFHAGDGFTVTPPRQLFFHGGADSNPLRLYGSTGADVVRLYPGRVELSGPGYLLTGRALADIYAEAACGGQDQAWFYDSAGDDTFVAKPNEAWLVTAAGGVNWALGFESSTAYAAAGGPDRAYFYDSAGADTFVGRPDGAWLVTAAGVVNYAVGFESSTAYSTAVGIDLAYFYDSAVDDTFVSCPTEAWLVTGTGVINYAVGFDQNTADASAGGMDRAYFRASSGTDTFASRPGESWLVTADGVVNYARYFDTYDAYATPGGDDVAYLYDSTGNVDEAVAETKAPTWIRVTEHAAWAPRDSSGELTYKDQMWLLGGWFTSAEAGPRDVWSSTNGTDWALVTPLADWEHGDLSTTLVYDGKMWIMGGWYGGRQPFGSASNQVWSSTDGAQWECVTSGAGWSPRLGAGGIVFDGKMWILGGVERYFDSTVAELRNDVWSSTDGANWILATAEAPWSARAFHGALVFDHKMWVFGGGNYLGDYLGYNDVWNSPDGVHWTQVTEHAPWSPRIWFSASVYKNKMWVLGGWSNNPSANWNDVWYTSDGFHWVELKTDTVWTLRHEQSAFVFQDKLWLAGGNAWPLVNDVWYLEIPGDRLHGRADWYRLTRAVDEVFGQGFGRVLADSGSGDDDILDVHDIDYLFTPTGDWEQIL